MSVSLVKAIRACVQSLSTPWCARPESLFSYSHPQVQAAYKTGWRECARPGNQSPQFMRFAPRGEAQVALTGLDQ